MADLELSFTNWTRIRNHVADTMKPAAGRSQVNREALAEALLERGYVDTDAVQDDLAAMDDPWSAEDAAAAVGLPALCEWGYRTWEGVVSLCVRPAGHAGGHELSPFVMMRDDRGPEDRRTPIGWDDDDDASVAPAARAAHPPIGLEGVYAGLVERAYPPAPPEPVKPKTEKVRVVEEPGVPAEETIVASAAPTGCLHAYYEGDWDAARADGVWPVHCQRREGHFGEHRDRAVLSDAVDRWHTNDPTDLVWSAGKWQRPSAEASQDDYEKQA